jgi:hypothetical protein
MNGILEMSECPCEMAKFLISDKKSTRTAK